MMVGSQEGSNVSYSYGFIHSVYRPLLFGFLPRVTIFLVIGVLLFLAISFRPVLVPYLDPAGLLAAGLGHARRRRRARPDALGRRRRRRQVRRRRQRGEDIPDPGADRGGVLPLARDRRPSSRCSSSVCSRSSPGCAGWPSRSRSPASHRPVIAYNSHPAITDLTTGAPRPLARLPRGDPGLPGDRRRDARLGAEQGGAGPQQASSSAGCWVSGPACRWSSSASC